MGALTLAPAGVGRLKAPSHLSGRRRGPPGLGMVREGLVTDKRETDEVAIYQITQATTATFTDLYLRVAFLFFIQTGSKQVLTPSQEIVAEEGDLLVFPPGSMVTMENRPLLDQSYRAVGVSFPDHLIRAVFRDAPQHSRQTGVDILRREDHRPMEILPVIMETLGSASLPRVVRKHRLVEPLLWLMDRGFHLSAPREDTPIRRVRHLIERDLSHPWRASEVAHHLAMSEATLRRLLASDGLGFAKILLNTRLEHGLGLLQTSDMAISQIAMRCGFKTPSHFSDAFRQRFGIRPKEIRSASH